MHTVVLDGPGKNALGTAMLEKLVASLEAANGEPVLLTGASGAFSAGLNLKEVGSLEGPAMRAFLVLLERAMTAVYFYPGPIACAVNGHAIAGGCVLTLACDARVVVDDPLVKLGLNEVALGLRFPPRTLALCKDRVPSRHRVDVFLGAELFAPREALRVGIVDEVATDPLAVAKARLEVLARHPRAAYAATKRDLRGTAQSLASDETLAHWLDESVVTWTSPELRARIASVLKK